MFRLELMQLMSFCLFAVCVVYSEQNIEVRKSLQDQNNGDIVADGLKEGPGDVGNTSEKSSDGSSTEEDGDFKAFKSAFLMKREEQKEMVQKIKEITNLKKQETFLKVTVTAIMKSISKARSTLSAYHYQVGQWPTPKDYPSALIEVRSALSSVVENFAIFSDLVLYFPDYVQSRVKKSPGDVDGDVDNDPWQLITWASTVAHIDLFLFSDIDKERASLALQQLNLIPRTESFVNPHSKEFKVEKLRQELELEMKKKNEKEKDTSTFAGKFLKKRFEEKRNSKTLKNLKRMRNEL